MMLGIARALIKSGYRPKYNLIFCAMAAEEWGVIGSKYDWSTGAYEEIFTARPQWRGQVIADLNFELPAYAHGRKDGLRCTYEYRCFLKDFVKRISPDATAYPDGIQVLSPIETLSLIHICSAELLLKEDGSVRMIRRAETPADYFATFDFCGLFQELK